MANDDTKAFEGPINEAIDLIKILGTEISSMIWGQPGLGKTEAIKAKFKGAEDDQGRQYEVINVLAGCSEPTDFSGIPFPYTDEQGRSVAVGMLAPLWAYRCSTIAPEIDQGPKVLFFDDIVTAHEQTQAACYKVIGEGRVGDLVLRDNVYMIAAGNRIDDKSAVTEMPKALGNRFKHYYTRVDFRAWETWAVSAGVHPLIIAYLRTMNQHLTNFEEVIEKGWSSLAFATPRSWEMLSKSLHTLDKAKLTDQHIHSSAAGCVGVGIARTFVAFVQTTSKLVTPQEIVDSPLTARMPTSSELDILHATTASLEHFISQTANAKYWKQALQYVLRKDMEAEFGLILAKRATTVVLNTLDDAGRKAAVGSKEFTQMHERWGHHLTIAK